MIQQYKKKYKRQYKDGGKIMLENCTLLLQLVITALKCHKYDKNIQVTGSATLFYLTNSEYRMEQSIKLRRQVIQVVLNGMESYQEVTVSVLPNRTRAFHAHKH